MNIGSVQYQEVGTLQIGRARSLAAGEAALTGNVGHGPFGWLAFLLARQPSQRSLWFHKTALSELGGRE